MTDINFLGKDNQDRDHEQKPKAKGGSWRDFVWSKPEIDEEKKGKPAVSLSNLPFFKNKSSSVAQASLDYNKIRQSRQEVLRLIKERESAKPLPDKNSSLAKAGAKFLTSLKDLKEKLMKWGDHKHILMDYQRVFDQEKDKRSRFAPAVGGAEKAAEKRQAAPPPRPEAKKNQPAEAAAEPVPEVLETNLIKDQIITYFDWQGKAVNLVAAVFLPIILVGLVYLGLMFYQKQSVAENMVLVDKFNQLVEKIKQEESGIEHIFGFQSELKLVSELFKEHIYWTNFFKFLEDNTIENVYYTNFTGDTGGKYSLNALADNYSNIAEQVNVLKRNKKVTAAEATGGELVGGGAENSPKVKFVLNFSVLRSIFTE